MIATLPLLESAYPEWDWTASNGSATAAQTAAAYTAIKNNGYCADFSRFVWNDLVELLASALSDAGIDWSATYGSVSATQISAKYGQLTAARFNAMRLNIDNVVSLGWRWRDDASVDGYLGRINMNGVSSYGAEADMVYGWYLEELARRVNLAIRILKDTAPFDELMTLTKTKSMTGIDVCAAAAAHLTVGILIESMSGSLLYPVPVWHLITGSEIRSISGSILYPAVVMPLGVNAISSAISDAGLQVGKGEALGAVGQSESITAVKLEDSTYAVKMRYQVPSHSYSLTELLFGGSIDFDMKELSWSDNTFDIKLPQALHIVVAECMDSGNIAGFVAIPELMMGMVNAQKSQHFGEVAYLPTMPIVSEIEAVSGRYADVTRHYPLLMRGWDKSETKEKPEITAVLPVILPSAIGKGWSYFSALPVAVLIVYLGEAFGTCQIYCIADSVGLEPYPVTASSAGASACNASAECVQGEFSGSGTSISEGDAEIDFGLPFLLGASDSGQSLTNAKLIKDKPVVPVAALITESRYLCELELEEGEGSSWIEPIQTDADLYIQQAYGTIFNDAILEVE